MIESIIENPKFISTSVLFLIGLASTGISLYFWIKAKASRNWDSTNGTIIKSEIFKDVNKTGNDGFSTMYKPMIRYSYQVGNMNYESQKIRIIFNYSNSSSERSNRLIAKYPMNSKVVVYYDPNKPNDSVLEPGLKSDIIIFLIIGICIVILSLIFAYVFGLLNFKN